MDKLYNILKLTDWKQYSDWYGTCEYIPELFMNLKNSTSDSEFNSLFGELISKVYNQGPPYPDVLEKVIYPLYILTEEMEFSCLEQILKTFILLQEEYLYSSGKICIWPHNVDFNSLSICSTIYNEIKKHSQIFILNYSEKQKNEMIKFSTFNGNIKEYSSYFSDKFNLNTSVGLTYYLFDKDVADDFSLKEDILGNLLYNLFKCKSTSSQEEYIIKDIIGLEYPLKIDLFPWLYGNISALFAGAWIINDYSNIYQIIDILRDRLRGNYSTSEFIVSDCYSDYKISWKSTEDVIIQYIYSYIVNSKKRINAEKENILKLLQEFSVNV
jgi:hypothetical protein